MSVTSVTSARHAARGMGAQLRLNVILLSQYRASFLIWTMAHTLQALVAVAVWSAVAGSDGGTTGGYDAAGFAGYFLVMLLVRELTSVGIVYHLPNRVRLGTIAILLLRPLHPLLQIAGASYANVVHFLVMMVPTAIALSVVMDATVTPAVQQVFAAALVMPFAVLARGCVDAVVATTSFWLVRIEGIRGVYFMMVLLLGGQFAPIDVLPDWLAGIARALPFYWSLGFPTELLVGRAQPDDAILGVVVLAAWSIGLLAFLQPMWRAGTRAYEAVGQ